jgi:hypothetical protein
MDAAGHDRFASVEVDTGMPIAYALAVDHPGLPDRLTVGEAVIAGITPPRYPARVAVAVVPGRCPVPPASAVVARCPQHRIIGVPLAVNDWCSSSSVIRSTSLFVHHPRSTTTGRSLSMAFRKCCCAPEPAAMTGVHIPASMVVSFASRNISGISIPQLEWTPSSSSLAKMSLNHATRRQAVSGST